MKLKQKTACLLAAAMVIASFGGMGTVQDASAAKAKAPKLSVAKKNVEPGKSFTLKIKKKGIKVINTTWKTSKKKVAAIAKSSKTSAKIKAKKKGTAKITATVKYKAGGKSGKKKLTCKVNVKSIIGNHTEPTAPAGQNPTQAPDNGGKTVDPTQKPTPEPTAAPYYYDYDYFAMYDCDKADAPDNFYVNFVLSDSWQINTNLSAIESIDLKVDSTEPVNIDLYVAEYDCDMESDQSKYVTTITTNGTKGEDISLTDVIKGNSDIAALDSTNNGRISFGFAPAGTGMVVIHDMYVNYYNNNTKQISHHKAAISVVTSALGSVVTKYNADKKAADDADQDFSATLEEYMAEKPEGMFVARPKDSSAAIENYSSLAKITEAKGYKFGTCVTYNQIKNDPEFCKLLAHHCDSITAMNEFKAYSLLDEEATLAAYEKNPDDETCMPVMKYDRADFLCEWARDNGLKIRGHALVWDNSMEENHKWFFTKGYKQDGGEYASNEICRKRLEYYVDQVMTHFQEKYPDVVYCWDVVNEGIDEGSSDKLKVRQSRMGQNPFYYHCSSEANGAGENYIKFTFECAYETREKLIRDNLLTSRDKIELVYNDFNIIDIYGEAKRGYVKALIQDLNSGDKQLVDAVGCQGYLGGYQKQEGCLDPQWVTRTTETIKMFSDMQPSVHVQLTEMAMRNFDYDYMDKHGEYAAQLFEGLANINSETNNAFTSMSIWAFIDDPVMNKVDESFDYWQYGPFSGMFDDVYRVKPAFENAYRILSQ